MRQTGLTALVSPDPTSNRPGSVIIETSILARVLGMKLLTLEGTVILSPAQLESGNSTDRTNPAPVEAPTGRPTPEPSSDPGRVGPGLIEASRLIKQNSELLDESGVRRPVTG